MDGVFFDGVPGWHIPGIPEWDEIFPEIMELPRGEGMPDGAAVPIEVEAIPKQRIGALEKLIPADAIFGMEEFFSALLVANGYGKLDRVRVVNVPIAPAAAVQLVETAKKIRLCRIFNYDPANFIYISHSPTVTAATGYPLAAQDQMPMVVEEDKVIYAIAAVASQARVAEFSAFGFPSLSFPAAIDMSYLLSIIAEFVSSIVLPTQYIAPKVTGLSGIRERYARLRGLRKLGDRR